MQCAVCHNADASSVQLQPGLAVMLQKHLSLDLECEAPSGLAVCGVCNGQLLAWNVFASLAPFCRQNAKQEPPSSPSSCSSDGGEGEVSEVLLTPSGHERRKLCSHSQRVPVPHNEREDLFEPDTSIFFPEVTLEVGEGNVFSTASQPVPQSSLETRLPQLSILGRQQGFQLADPIKHHCDRCHKVFKKMSNLKRHMSIHSDNRQLLYCSFCRAHFDNRGRMRDHILQWHLDQRRFKCELCYLSFKRFQHLKRHTEIKHNPNKKTYPCEFCGKNFNSVPNKGFHIIRVHSLRLTNPPSHVEGLACNVCGKLVKTPDILKRHRLLHDNNKPTFECKECGKVLSRKDKLKEHVVTNHSGNEPIRCKVCGKQTPNEDSHRRHMQLHSADRPVFPCPFCSKVYTSTISRAYHMVQVHQSSKPAVLPRVAVSEARSRDCQVCGKTMQHSKSLRGHMLRHTRNGETVAQVSDITNCGRVH